MFYFTPLRGFFSPFPRGTISLSLTQKYLALRGGPRWFTRNSTCSMLLGIRLFFFYFTTTRLSLSMVQDSAASLYSDKSFFLSSHYTHFITNRFRLFPVRSPLLRESLLLSFPPATKMFQFTGLPLSNLWIRLEVLQVALFGDLRIKACCQLLEAFRRYLRPSSSLSA